MAFRSKINLVGIEGNVERKSKKLYMMKQKTAVEWLEERFDKYMAWRTGDHKATEYTYQHLVNDFDKARQMEKEQIVNAHYEGQCNNQEGYPIEIAANYYSETYTPNT